MKNCLFLVVVCIIVSWAVASLNKDDDLQLPEVYGDEDSYGYGDPYENPHGSPPAAIQLESAEDVVGFLQVCTHSLSLSL
jgi:hypothetical protein